MLAQCNLCWVLPPNHTQTHTHHTTPCFNRYTTPQHSTHRPHNPHTAHTVMPQTVMPPTHPRTAPTYDTYNTPPHITHMRHPAPPTPHTAHTDMPYPYKTPTYHIHTNTNLHTGRMAQHRTAHMDDGILAVGVRAVRHKAWYARAHVLVPNSLDFLHKVLGTNIVDTSEQTVEGAHKRSGVHLKTSRVVQEWAA